MAKKRHPGRMQFPSLKELQELQAKIQEAQEALGQETVTATAGGGAITVVMTGDQRVKTVEIDPQVLEDVEMLQDLIIAAVNEAIERSQELAARKMSGFTGLEGLL